MRDPEIQGLVEITLSSCKGLEEKPFASQQTFSEPFIQSANICEVSIPAQPCPCPKSFHTPFHPLCSPQSLDVRTDRAGFESPAV